MSECVLECIELDTDANSSLYHFPCPGTAILIPEPLAALLELSAPELPTPSVSYRYS